MRKKKKYLVGYDQDYQCVYGKADSGKIKDVSYTDPMTIYDAKLKLKQMYNEGAVIYELKRVKPTDSGIGD